MTPLPDIDGPHPDAGSGPCLLCSQETDSLGMFAPQLDTFACFRELTPKRRTFVYFLCEICRELPGQFEIGGLKFTAVAMGDLSGD